MNKKIIIKSTLITIILLILILAGCITTTDNSEEEQNNNLANYTINLPDEWISIDPVNNYDAIYAPNKSTNIYFYSTTPQIINIGQSISTIANQIIEREENTRTSFTLISSKNIDVKTVSAYEIIYTYKENNIVFKAKHAPIKDKDTLYELIYTAPQNQYEQYITEIDQAIYSFRPS